MRAKQPSARISQVERELESIHHHLWHSDSDIVNWQIGALVNELESTIAPAYLDHFSPLRSTLDKMIDLRKYLIHFQDETYSIEHREKQPVSTSPVESLINRLVNHRMNKRQQMRWSVHGAQSLLQLRVALLNRTLGPIFGQWYPGFSVSHIIEPTELQAA